MRQQKQERWKRQFLANFDGWCRHFQAPPVEILLPLPDRALYHGTGEWISWLNDFCWGWDVAIAEHNPLHLPRSTAHRGWRERVPFGAAQFVLHDPAPPFKSEWLEVDFDIGNPAGGLVPLLVHAAEWAWYRLPMLRGESKRLTNPFWIRRILRRRGIQVEKV
ncbi:MAG: hypothetical protein JRI39_00285 [Deltaproteobacteria bacterium]|nr:hypothetical protein [Deltaproteobacteria bacterium]